MRSTNCKIGFHDGKMMLFMIPLVSFLIPIVFFGLRIGGKPTYTLSIYLSTLFITTVIWLGNRYLMIRYRTRYPHFKDVRKRLLMQSLAMLAFTFISNNLLGYLLDDYCLMREEQYGIGRTLGDILLNSNSASLFSTLTIVAIYESVYFMRELQRSIEEKEALKREQLDAQLSALRTQVNPHFLFNNLNTLCSIIPEDPKLATNFVQQLSTVYRHILEVKDETSIPLEDELRVLKAYAFLLQTRFGKNLEIDFSVSPQKLQHRIVPLSLQLLMENAIKHNIVSTDKPLKIEVFTHNGSLVVKNRLQKKNQLLESTGIGLNNIRNRYQLLGNQEVQVQQDEQSFTVSIPLLLQTS